MPEILEKDKFFAVGNNLSLDFVNTEKMSDGQPNDLLERFEDLAAWAVVMGLLSHEKAVELVKRWGAKREAMQAFEQSLKFRAVLREMVIDIEKGEAVKQNALDAINDVLNNQGGYVELQRTENGFEKRFRADFREPVQLLVPIAESAADLLCYGNPAYLKKCENLSCILHFYDTTKNHKRRWCSMKGCGNRAKAAAFYQRKKSKTG